MYETTQPPPPPPPSKIPHRCVISPHKPLRNVEDYPLLKKYD